MFFIVIGEPVSLQILFLRSSQRGVCVFFFNVGQVLQLSLDVRVVWVFLEQAMHDLRD
jgi:hypothetical protein